MGESHHRDPELTQSLSVVRTIDPTATNRAADLTGSSSGAITSWGHLRLDGHIGGGAFGEVHRAWDEKLGRHVALKLHRDQGSRDERRRATFLREARLLAKVDHPHVVTVHGVDEHDGRIGIWMELVEGQNLAELVTTSGPLGARDATLIGVDLCSALAAVHGAGIVHGDVKSENALRAAGGRIVLMDFGLGSLDPEADVADSAGITGTPLYLAPERFQGAPATPGSDIYALGVLLFHLVTGAHPIAAESVRQVVDAHAAGAHRHLRDVRPDLPPAFVAVVERALASDPGDRFRSAGEMECALVASLGLPPANATPARMTTDAHPRRLGRVGRAGRIGLLLLGIAIVAFVTTWVARPPALEADVRFMAAHGSTVRALAPGDGITSTDRIQVEVRLTKAAHVYVLNRDAAGNTTVMFPIEDWVVENPVPGGEPVRLPGSIDGMTNGWTFSDDAGVESFLVVASTEPLISLEHELARAPTVTASGGLSVTPISENALAAMTRGVTGMAPPARTDGGYDPSLFSLARHMGTTRNPDTIWLREYRLLNAGQSR